MLFLGIDIGTTAVKAALFTIEGRSVGEWRRDYPTTRSRGGFVEQDPQDWARGVHDAIGALGVVHDLRAVRAVGICGQVNTHVFVDDAGSTLCPAIVWQDTRASAEAAELDALITDRQRREWWGSPARIDASHPLARMRWMQVHRPEVWDKTRYVFSPKDFCTYQLTHRAVADPVASVGLVDPFLHYIGGLTALMPGARERLPPLTSFDAVIGEMRVAATAEPVPLVAGTMDAWASLFGAGAFVSGKGMYMSGTSEIVALVGTQRLDAGGVISFPTVDGVVVHAGPTQSGGDSVRWWAQASGCAVEDVFESAVRARTCDDPIVFLPHLEGERAPLWDTSLRGAFIGLSSRSGGAELAYAVLEGVALSARLLLQSLEAASGVHPESLLYGGGGSDSDLWSQIRADCLGRELRRLCVRDAGCLGAALLAAVGSGHFKTITEAGQTMARIERVFYPDARRKDRYADMYGRYTAAIDALRRAYS